MRSESVARVAARFRSALADVSTPVAAADYLRAELAGMFPGHYIKVVGERGVSIAVGRLSEDDYAREQLQTKYTNPPNLLVKLLIVPSIGSGQWADLFVRPAIDNPELKQVGIKPIRKMSNLTPEKAVAAVLKWFKTNQHALAS